MGRLEASLQASVARPQLESVLRELQSSRAASAALAAELQERFDPFDRSPLNESLVVSE